MNARSVNKISIMISACACAFIATLLSFGKIDAHAANTVYTAPNGIQYTWNGSNTLTITNGSTVNDNTKTTDDSWKTCSAFSGLNVQSKLTTVVIEERRTGKEGAYKYWKVYGIGDHSFENCTALTTVRIETNSITRIGKYAFANCTNMNFKEWTVNNNTVGGNGVDPKWDLKSSDRQKFLPDLTEIDDYAFYNCAKFNPIIHMRFLRRNTADGNKTFCRRRDYYNCLGARANSNNEVKSDSLLKRIGAHAFDGCSSMTSFGYYIHENTWKEYYSGQNGGYCALSDFKYNTLGDRPIAKVCFYNNLEEIGDYAFANCPKLTHCVFDESDVVFNDRTTIFAGSHTSTGANKVWDYDRPSDGYNSSFIRIDASDIEVYYGASKVTKDKTNDGTTTPVNIINGACINSQIGDVRIERREKNNLLDIRPKSVAGTSTNDDKKQTFYIHFYPAGTLKNHLTDSVSALKTYEIPFKGVLSFRDMDSGSDDTYGESWTFAANQLHCFYQYRDTFVTKKSSTPFGSDNRVCFGGTRNDDNGESRTSPTNHGRKGTQYWKITRLTVEVESTPDNPLLLGYYAAAGYGSIIGMNLEDPGDTELFSKVNYHIVNPQESGMLQFERTGDNAIFETRRSTHVVLDNPEYSGYSFLGWHWDAACTKPAPESFFLEEVEYDLYGKFEVGHAPCEATLNIYPNNGEWTGGSEDEMLSPNGTYYIEIREYKDNEPVPTMYIDNTKITRDGFIFDGWDYDGTSGCWANNKFTFKDKAVGNLHARWKRTEDTVTAGRGGKGVSVTVNNGQSTVFGLKGADGTNVNSVVDSQLLSRIPASKRNGSAGGGANVQLTDVLTYSNSGKTASVSKIKDYNKPSLTGNPDITMSPVPAVRFDLNGVTGTIPGAVEKCYYVFDTDDVTATVTPDVESSELNAKKIDSFLGWSTSYNGPVVFAKDTPITASDIKTILNWNDSSKPRTISLYAIWKYKNITNIHVTDP